MEAGRATKLVTLGIIPLWQSTPGVKPAFKEVQFDVMAECVHQGQEEGDCWLSQRHDAVTKWANVRFSKPARKSLAKLVLLDNEGGP